MRLLKISALALILVLLIGAGLAFLAPSILAQPVLSYYLTSAGFELAEFSGISIGRERTSIERLVLGNDKFSLTATISELDYSLPALLGGTLRGLSIEHLQVDLLQLTAAPSQPDAEDSRPMSEQVSAMLAMLNNLPLSNLQLGAIDVRSEDTRFDVVLEIDTQPLRVSGSIASSAYSGLMLNINARTDAATDQIEGDISVLQNSQLALQAEFVIRADSDNVHLQLQADADLAVLTTETAALFENSQFALLTDRATIELELSATDLLGSPSIQALHVILDTANHQLQATQQLDQSNLDIQLQLPLHLAATLPALDQQLQLAIDPMNATVSYANAETSLTSEIDFGTTELACSLQWVCEGATSIAAQILALDTSGITAQDISLQSRLSFANTDAGVTLTTPAIALSNAAANLRHVATDTAMQFEAALSDVSVFCSAALNCNADGLLNLASSTIHNPALAAERAHLEGAVSLSYNESSFTLSAPALTLELPVIRADTLEMSFASTLSDLVATVSPEISASFTITSQRIDPGLQDFTLRNPSIAGTVKFADDTIESVLILAIANQLRAQVGLNYDVTAKSGALNWELTPYTFSKITPLSALIVQSLLKADLVAGSIAGSGNFSIGLDAEDNWLLDGPLTFSANDLGGFIAETFFVGLSTEIAATVLNNGDIQTRELLAGSIATLDVGMPMTDIHWNYGFDSSTQRLIVKNLAASTLGGEVSIADIDYDMRNPDTTLNLILANLDLQSIVGLAQYPGLKVEGLISGYLPLKLSGQTLTIDEGLVGALQPGGTIRYASGSPASSGNSTLNLVNQALANYHYQIMNTRVNYNETGDLRLEVQLQGNNPDLYNGQVVNLNVNIDDNIPTLLRSLQASRTITDALEQRLQNRRQNGNR